jgi:uncharacterized protein (DUF1697 family)
VGTVLRTHQEVTAMIASRPFVRVGPDQDVKLYVTMLDKAPDIPPNLPSVPGDYEVVRIDPREIYVVALRTPNGRYGPGMDTMGRGSDKSGLATTRNWKTMIKAAEA